MDKQELIHHLHRAVAIDREPSARLCTPERISEIGEVLKTNTSDYPWRESFEDIWRYLSEIQRDYYQQISMVERENDYSSNCIEELDFAIDMPRFPAPEVLIAISEAFRVYMAAGGALELEDVFFGPAKKGVGNYAARKRKEQLYNDFEFYVNFGDISMSKEEIEKHRESSLESKAIEYLAHGKMNPHFARVLNRTPNYYDISDPESYLRGYRRWKRNKRTTK